ncbi:separin-like [Haliotis cracherodii]|uniref:separin-like n=1 Tax=Haliotis cracherodii TaxID=6455 RepID=UPI0039EC3D90
MADKSILENISKRNFDAILGDTKEYLSSILTVKGKAKNGDLKEKGMFAVKFLHSAVAVVGNDVPEDLIAAVHICCQGYQTARDNIKLQDELTVPKLVYHILNKLVQESHMDNLHQLGVFLYGCLHGVTTETPGVKPIVMNTYSRLWNSSVKHEATCSNPGSLLITTQLRFLAMKFLFKKEVIEDSDVEKIEIALGRYIHLANKLKLKKSAIQADLRQVLSIFVTMLENVLTFNKEKFGLIVIKSVIRAVKYLSQNKLLGDVQHFLEVVSESGADNPMADMGLIQVVTRILTVVKQLDTLLQEECSSDARFDEVASVLMSGNEGLMTVTDEDQEDGGHQLVVLELCQVLMMQLKSVPLTVNLSVNLMEAGRMTMTLYLHFLESEWRLTGEAGTPSTGLKRDQIERNMLDAFHVKFQMFYKLSQAVTDDEELETLLDECLEAVGLYLNVLGVVESDKTHFDDKYYFGYLMVKFGHFCYNRSLDKQATEFYRNTCQQLTEWCFSDTEKKQARIEESSLWKIYNCLTECYRRRGMWKEAMETIAMYLHIDASHANTLVQLWVRIKRDATREGQQDFVEKTMKDVFDSEGEERPPTDGDKVLCLLQSELEAFKGIKKRWSEGEAVVLKDLVSVVGDSGTKAGYLLSLAQIMWVTGIETHRSAKECVNDVLELLCKTTSSEGYLTLAQGYLWRFIITREDLCKQYLLPAGESEPDPGDEEPSARKGMKDGVKEELAPGKVYTLQQCEMDVADMDQALTLMMQGIEAGISNTSQLDLAALTQNLIMAASIFRLLRKPVQELQTLCMALSVCPSADVVTAARVRQDISRVLMESGQYHMAEMLLPAADTTGATEDSHQKILLQLLKERIHLLTQKMEPSLTRMLSVVESLVKANSKSWIATLTEGVAKRLLSMFLIQPVQPDTHVAEYALSLAQEAVKLHTAVVHFLMGRDMESVVSQSGKDPHVLDKWMVVSELLESILHLCHLYRHVGDVKDARGYLREGLKISKRLCLPRWTTEFLLELGRINSISSNEKECLRLLKETSMILRQTPGKEEVSVLDQKPQKVTINNKTATAKKPRATRGKSASANRKNKVKDVEIIDDCFGFESVRDAGIKRPSESDVASILGPLSSLSLDVELPASVPHNTDCSCSLCQDIIVQGLDLLYSETLGEFYQYSGSLEKGWDELKKVESSKSALERLTADNTTIMHEQLKSAELVSTSNKKSSTQLQPVLLPSIRQLSIETYCLLAQTALKKCESETADFLSQSALKIINSDTSKDLLQQSFLKAQLQLVQIQARLQATGDVFVASDKALPAKPAPARGRARSTRQKKSTTSRRGKSDTEEDIPAAVDHQDASVKDSLTSAFTTISHFPSSDVYGHLCRMLACQHLNTDELKAAYFLNEAVSITFRHQALANTSRKIRKVEKELATCEGELETLREDLEDLCRVRSLLAFNKEVSHFQQMMQHIPPDWTVCQITLAKSAGDANRLLLTRLTCHTDPVTVELPGFETVQGRSILPEFKAIIQTSSESMKLTDKNQWWQTRRDLNDRVQSVVDLMEKYWLGKWVCLLQGQLSLGQRSKVNEILTQLQKDIKKSCKIVIEPQVLELLLTLCISLPVDNHIDIATKLVKVNNEAAHKLTTAVSKCCETLASNMDSHPCRQPVLLVLDKDVQHLPWESLPSLRSHPVTRIPSLYHLHTQLSAGHMSQSHACVSGVDIQNAFYILNPDNDLMSTQESFENLFREPSGWSGLIGEKPTPNQFKSALTDHDLFIYCGHGSGCKYYSGSDLQQLRCRAVAVLMGCSSGYLQTRGILEATGMINNYFLAGCPTIIANLWDVTDRDIDRFLGGMLTSWMSSEGEGSLLEAIPAARDQCRLPFLIGAAPVVYGFPVSFRR